MYNIFTRIVFFCLLTTAIVSCKKADNFTETATPAKKTAVIGAYTVHASVRKLDSVSADASNYEFSFWVTTDADSLNALQLPGSLLLNGEIYTSTGLVPASVELGPGTYITRKVFKLSGPVYVKGKFSVPGSYMGKPIQCSATITEKPYNLKKIHVQGTGFADEDGKPFVPWGLNYTNTNELRLVDDDWYNPVNWEIIKQDIREMRALDINILRIHLEYNRFMISAKTPNIQALKRLRDLVDFAGTYGLYLDITGLACYIKADTPVWYDALNEADRWASQAVFWSSVAQAVGNRKNVFAYCLMNEPITPSKSTDIWLPGEPYGGYHFVQYLTREPAGRSWITVTRQWIQTLKPAIRAHDSNTMITVGFIGLGVIAQFNDLLDYNSAHIYPESGKIQQALNFIDNNLTDKPLVIEETAALAAGFDDMKTFIKGCNGKTAGFMAHYAGQTIEELEPINTLPAAITREWYKIFCFELNPNYKKPLYD